MGEFNDLTIVGYIVMYALYTIVPIYSVVAVLCIINFISKRLIIFILNIFLKPFYPANYEYKVKSIIKFMPDFFIGSFIIAIFPFYILFQDDMNDNPNTEWNIGNKIGAWFSFSIWVLIIFGIIWES